MAYYSLCSCCHVFLVANLVNLPPNQRSSSTILVNNSPVFGHSSWADAQSHPLAGDPDLGSHCPGDDPRSGTDFVSWSPGRDCLAGSVHVNCSRSRTCYFVGQVYARLQLILPFLPLPSVTVPQLLILPTADLGAPGTFLPSGSTHHRPFVFGSGFLSISL